MAVSPSGEDLVGYREASNNATLKKWYLDLNFVALDSTCQDIYNGHFDRNVRCKGITDRTAIRACTDTISELNDAKSYKSAVDNRNDPNCECVGTWTAKEIETLTLFHPLSPTHP